MARRRVYYGDRRESFSAARSGAIPGEFRAHYSFTENGAAGAEGEK